MRKRLQLITTLLILAAGYVSAQQFTPLNAGLIGVGRSSVAWADYDLDGDLDLLITGNSGSGPYAAAVYRNDDGTFVNINASLTGIDNSSVAWGDYDNDGDPDILATGRSSGSSYMKTWLYANDNGVFTSVSTPFHNVGSYGSVAWGDTDGDGDLDALISGYFSTKLFRNDNGTFVELDYQLPQVSNCFVTIGDYDNDGDQDLFVMGDMGGWPVSTICRNDQGMYTLLDSTGIMPLSGGSASWCDYDHDKDLDILISGFDQYLEPKTYIFRNDGELTFVNVWPGLAGAALGISSWGDYDNDGDADILLTGQNAACGSLSSIVYRNDGNDNFTDINAPLTGAERGSGAWGDYDNDGDLDIVISGFNGSGLPVAEIYRNESGSNTPTSQESPAMVTGLNAEVSGNMVKFSWEIPNDNTTPGEGITYNLRVGSMSGGQDVLTANTDDSGFHLIPQPGNIGNDTSWMLNLPDGSYFWSVQALDHGLGCSLFAPEQQFTVGTVGIPSKVSGNMWEAYPNPFRDYVALSGGSGTRVDVVDVAGHRVWSGDGMKSYHINTSQWAAGTYYFRLVSGNNSVTTKIMVKNPE